MKDNYSKSVSLRCITCGDTSLEYNEDKSFPNVSNVRISEFLSVTDINPQSSMDIYVSVHYESPSTLQVDYEWEDGAKLDNRGGQVLQLR